MDKSAYQVRIDQWKVLIHDQAVSNMTKSAWCRENGISPRKFYYWQRKLRNLFLESASQLPELPSSGTSGTTFCELSVPKQESLSFTEYHKSNLIIEISDCRILVGESVSKDALASVIEVLRHV